MITGMIHAALFEIVFHGLVLMAALVFFATVLPVKIPGSGWLRLVALPMVQTVGAVTPAIIPARLQPLLTIFWLLSLRLAFYLGLAAFQMLPPVPPT